MPEALLSAQDLAQYCQVPLWTVYRWNSNRTGPRSIKCGKYVRYRQRDVDAWLDEQASDTRRPSAS